MTVALVLTLSLLLPPQPARPADAPAITGTVRDTGGGAVAGAAVIARAGAREQHAVTGPDGRFSIAAPDAAEVLLIVRAAGFSELRRKLDAASARSDLSLVVSPATLTEAVTVTATRSEQRTGDVPASVNLLEREDIRHSPALVADDVLRQIPTFSLFRRTSSLASHPTAQGVSLRGIGPSGVSRTLVLVDGVPINDPFGGWVYWSRVPLERADRIEVVDSNTSSLYGNYAMGGVIHFITAPAAPKTADVKIQYGSRNTPKVDFAGSHVWGNVGISVDGNVFDTDGYEIVRANERGRVDNRAAAQFWNLNTKIDYTASSRARAFVKAGYFDEERDNGKASTIDGTEEANSTTWRNLSAGVRFRLPDESVLQATVFSDRETFQSNFLAVPASTPPRNIGRMTLTQRVPTDSFGGMVQWSRVFGPRQFLSAGTDWRWVDGDSQESGLDAATGLQVVLQRVSGGTQRSVGAFVQDMLVPIPELTLTFSARIDNWRNYDGHNLETSLIGAPVNNIPSLAVRSDTVASPRAAARYHVTDRVDVWGNIGWGFRAPTLNELYRQFRVGTTLTLANHALGPERLVGGEAGVSIAASPNVTFRSTWFDNRIKDPVSNVTIGQSGTTITQQRQNLGRTRVWGIQNDLEYRLGDTWKLAAAYVYDQATVTEHALNRTLVGKFLAQVPAHRASVRAAYSNPRLFTLAAAAQLVGGQFDDDLNTPARRLPKYTLLDLTASRQLGRNAEVFLGVQNLFDEEYLVGTLPTTVGAPRLVTGGIRLRFR